MRILICTGNGGSGSSLVASATASTVAEAGRKTLLASIGPSHSLPGLLGMALADTPQTIAPNLDAWVVNTSASLRAFTEQVRPRLLPPLANLSSDELPLIPGIDFFLCLAYLRQFADSNYELMVIDAGQHDALLRVLALPDSFRWFVRLMFGLDRGPGRSGASVNRALLPTTLMPSEWLAKLQDTRVQFEEMRDLATEASRTTVRYVLRPDMAALEEARLAVPALHLHGLAVDALIVGPLLPADIADARLTQIVAQQQDVATEAARIWESRPVLRLPATIPDSLAALATLGQALYALHHPTDSNGCPPPIVYGDANDPFVAISLPGVQREVLNLTMSGDELIIQTGPYRRHILLPEALRGKSNIRANRDGERLIVRLRQ